MNKGGSMGSLTDMIEQLAQTANLTKDDALKCENGNKSAGIRVRKAMQEVKKMAQEIRIAVTNMK